MEHGRTEVSRDLPMEAFCSQVDPTRPHGWIFMGEGRTCGHNPHLMRRRRDEAKFIFWKY